MFLSTKTYHGVYPDIIGRGSGTVSVLDQQICLEGMHILIERGMKQKGHGKEGLIDEFDIQEVFKVLGGGSIYTLQDGRTVLDWWKHGSSTGVRQLSSFDQRLEVFNEKIKFKRDKKTDSAELFLKQFQKIAYDRFWKKANYQVDDYNLLNRLGLKGLSKFLSIPDALLMRMIFPQQLNLDRFI